MRETSAKISADSATSTDTVNTVNATLMRHDDRSRFESPLKSPRVLLAGGELFSMGVRESMLGTGRRRQGLRGPWTG
jgi:hypothetical protein